MNKRNKQLLKKHGRTKKRKIKQRVIFILVIFIVLMVIVLFWKLLSKGFGEHVILNPTDIQSSITLDDVSSAFEENGSTPSSTADTEWNLTLVNQWHAIPENYEIHLVEVPGGQKVDERIIEPLMEMLEAAKEGNWNQLPKVVSGYRTTKKQQQLYDDKIAEYKQKGYSNEEALKQAKQWVAAPGYSEHQLGIAVDINGATYDLYVWLQENSYKYGFIFRYPGNKTDITGTSEEVWHYRYVGVEAATEIYQQGLCLEEYLDQLEK